MKKIILLGILLIVKQITFSQCLSGVYTIGGTAPSYTSITQAVSSLTVNGVCGPVTFNIRPGTYTEKITIPVIAGTSSVNTISFQSESLDSSSVLIQSTGINGANYIFQLNGADFISFQKLSFKNMDANYMCNFYLTNGVLNFKLSNCVIEGPITASTLPNANRYLINSASNTNVNCIIQNNKITGGQRGIYASSTAALITDFRILNNVFFNQYEHTISLSGVRAPKIISNKISYNLSNIGFKGMYISSSNDVLVIDKNNIEQTLGEPMTIFFASGNISNYSSISNNRINVSGGSSATTGIYLQNASYVNVYHNTIVSANTNTASSCISLYTMSNVNVKNNILYHKGLGFVYYVANSLTNATFDYNDEYFSGPNFAYNISGSISNFNNWKSLGYDYNSLNYIPQFVSNSDFHIASDFSQNLPIPFITSVPDDIEGTLRDNSAPYFGAYEYFNVLTPVDASASRIIYPAVICQGMQPINVLLRNFGSSALTSVEINWSINGTLQSPFNWTGNLAFNDSIAVSVGSLNFVNLGAYTIKAWTSIPNATTDGFLLNDTILSPPIYTSLSGIYTIGGSAPSFSTVTSAITNLKNRGVCGNVTFNIRNGIYNDNMNLSSINGLSGTNTLLIQSESGVSTDVQIVSTTTLNTVIFSGASNVTLKNLTIGNFNILSNAIVINSGGHNLEINSCIIDAQAYYGIQGNLSSGSLNKLSVLTNTFSSGYYAINLTGSAIDKFLNLKVNNNKITSSTNSHIAISYADTIEFKNNNATVANVNGPALSIMNSSKISVIKNKINTKDNSALFLSYANDALVANNMFVGSGALINFVVNITNANSTHFINNSINSIATNTNTSAFYYYNNNTAGSGNHVWNNIIQSSVGIPVNINTGTVQSRFRNNAYGYTGNRFGVFNGTTISNFANWQTTTLTDTNSIFVNPQFTSSTDLHANEILLKGSGISVVADITDDIDGQVRNFSTPDIGADEFTVLPVDAGTNGFSFSTILCAGTNSIQVFLKNNGNSNLTSVKINCKINSVTLPIYNWSGNLAPGTQTLVTIASYNFLLNTNYLIKAWSALPNGISDVFYNNDTTSTTYANVGMSGVYTIGGTTPDYTTITSAVNALKNGGLCGPVIFKIRNGIYNEQIRIPNIKGASSLNTILFQSESLDSSLVSIEYISSSTSNYIINVDSTDYVTFYKLGFKPLNNTYANVLTFTNKTTHIQVKNCSFTGQPSSGTLITMSSNCDSTLISNNRFYKGSIAFFANSIYNKVLGNYLEGQSQSGINANGLNFDYSSNYFNYSGTTCQGIVVNGLAGGKITKNKILYGVTTNTAVVLSGFGTSANPLLVNNNFISLTGGCGISLLNMQYSNLLYNSINQLGNGTCMTYSNIANSSNQNNIFYDQQGVCVTTNSLNSGFVSNYNCIYSPTNLLFKVGAITYTTISLYNAYSSMEANSVNTDPLFTSAINLHVTNCAGINGAANVNSNVLDDIDGDVRNATTPDIGADEFNLANIGDDAQVYSAYFSNSGCGGTQTLYAKIKNIGINNLSSLQLSGKYGNVVITPVTWNGTLAQGQTKDSISLGTFSGIYGNPVIKLWSFLPNGNNDNNLTNDTLLYQIPNAALKGVYKVGGTSPDFVNLRAAKNALTTYGVCGPVTFDIRAGIYQDTLSIPAVAGTSSVNIVTFQSENGDSTSVIISDFATNATDNPHYVIRMRLLSNIIFSKLTFMQSAISSSGTTSIIFGDYVSLNYSNIKFSNCRFLANSATTNVVNLNYVQTLQNFQFNNNLITGGVYGLYLSGANSALTTTSVKENIFYNQSNSSISFNSMAGNNFIEKNNIRNPNSSTGIVANYGGTHIIKNNRVIVNSGIGISTNNNLCDINNNFVLIKNTNGNNGLNIYSPYTGTKIYYNTIRVNNAYSAISVNYLNAVVKNNIFENKGSGTVYYLYSPSSSTVTNNRCYTNGANFGTVNTQNYTSFSAWKTATGYDNNSQNSSTYFLNDSTYKVIGDYTLNGAASLIPTITSDIDGTLRDVITPDIGAYEFNLINNDAALTRFVNPLDSVLCTGNSSISVTLKNMGLLPLTSANINWKVNGVIQPNYNWSGNIVTGDSVIVNIGNISLNGARGNQFTFYVSSPNGVADVSNFNDTLKTKFIKTRLSGIYTIGGISPNFTTLKQAADSLQKFGICGAVTFNIRNGIYRSKFNLSNYQGSSNYSVIFQSESMDSSLVVISDTGGVSWQGAIYLLNTQNLKFHKLTFIQNSPGNITTISLANKARNITVSNCVFIYTAGSSGSYAINADFAQDTLNRNFRILNNKFGNTALVRLSSVSSGTTTNKVRNLILDKNIFVSGTTVISGIDSISLSNNKIENGFSINNSHQSINVFNNKFYNSLLSLTDCYGGSFVKNIYNNSLDTSRIALTNVPSINVYHNSILYSSNLYGYQPLSITGTLNQQKIKNNIICNNGGGQVLSVSDPNFVTNSLPNIFNNNDLYSRSDSIIRVWYLTNQYVNKSSWQNIYSQDQSSLFVKPSFAGNHDLHIVNDHQLNNAGLPNTIALLDLDGVTRNTSAPDIGAYEFNAVPTTDDAGIQNIQNINGHCDRVSNNISVTLKNYGVNNLTSADIHWSLNSMPQSPYHWSGILSSGDTAVISIGTYTPQNGVANYISVNTTLPNGNTDGFFNNDTVKTNLGLPKLNGIYIVGGASANFTSLTDVINTLNNQGICGPVTFKFSPGGYTYLYSYPTLGSVPGNNFQNTITFESLNGNKTSVLLQDIYFTISNVYGVTFKNLTFKDDQLFIGNNAKKVTFEGNTFDGHPTFDGGVFSTISSNQYHEDVSILNNFFTDCSQSFVYYSHSYTTTPTPKRILIRGNVFDNPPASAIMFNGVDSLVIDSNIFNRTNNTNSYTSRAIYMGYPKQYFKMSRNKISGNFGNAIDIGFTSGTYKGKSTVENNVISTSLSNYGAISNRCDSISFYYNTIYVQGTGDAVYLSSGYNKLYNNIISSQTGKCMVVSNTVTLNSDYNVFYTGGTTLLTSGSNSVTSLSSYSTTSGKEVHSIVANPQYVNLPSDLHYLNPVLDGKATPLTLVLKDQQNKLRDLTTPNPGAYEQLPDTTIDIVNKSLVLKSILTPTLVVGTGNVIKASVLYTFPQLADTNTYKYRGTIDSLRMHYQVNNQPEIIEKWHGALHLNDSLTYTFSSPFYVPNGKLYSIKVWFENLNPNQHEDNFLDDSLTKIIKLPMSGDYTIGGTYPDFPSFSYSSFSIYQCGVNGNLRFLLRPGYHGLFRTTNVAYIYDVEYRPESGNTNEVSIDLSLGADVKFTKLVINPICGGSGTAYGPYDGVQVLGSSKMMLDSCLIKGGNTPCTRVGFHFLQPYNGNTAIIRNSTFKNLEFALYISSHAVYASYGVGDFIFENNIVDSCNHGVIVNSFASPYWLRIKNNTITTYSTGINLNPYGTGYGNNFGAGKFEVSGNKINSEYGFFINSQYGYNNTILVNRLVMFNNMSTSTIANSIAYVNQLEMYNNSFNKRTYVFARDSIKMYNNIFVNNDTLECLDALYCNGLLKSDNNNYYSPNSAKKVVYEKVQPSYPYYNINTNTFNNVSQIKTVLQTDSHSVAFPPLYLSSTDLHSQSSNMKGMAKPLSIVSVDFDGESRLIDAPDIGADEIQLITGEVWPGDANNDLIVNSQDLFPIGLYFGNHKYARDSISNLFIGNTCNDWLISQVGGVDMKYADCNGDSTINMNDTLAVNLNYNNVHAAKTNQTNSICVNPDIYLQYNKSLYLPGDTVKADVFIGSSVNPQSNLYGASFSLGYNPTMVKQGSVKMNFMNSWIGVINSSKIKFSHINSVNGILDASVVRITHNDVSGFGKIGTFQFVLKDSVFYPEMHLNVYAGNKINQAGIISPLNSCIDSIQILNNGTPTVLKETMINNITVYPNPASDYVKINFGTNNNVKYRVEVNAIDGKVIIIKTITSNDYILPLGNISKGVYVLKLIMDDKSSKVFKLVIQ